MGSEEDWEQTSLLCGESTQCLGRTGFVSAHGACAFPVHTSQALGFSARELSEAGLGCVPFPGLSRSGSGSRGLHKGAHWAGPAFCALPRSEQLRRPGAWGAQSPQVGTASYHLPDPSRSVSWVAAGTPVSSAVSLLGTDLWM